MKRREFLSLTIKAGAALVLPTLWSGCNTGGHGSAVALPDLPYPMDALEPHLSAKTIDVHFSKHHKGYVDKVNRLVKGTLFDGMPLEEMIVKSAGEKEATALFNNAAQVYNHTFYWNSMSPDGGGKPPEAVMAKLEDSFGGFDAFLEAFAGAATGQFGSGWAWLVQKDQALAVLATANADTPITLGLKPVLVVDVWEHAYYLDYQNRRKAYVEAFLEHLVNWEFAMKNVAIAV